MAGSGAMRLRAGIYLGVVSATTWFVLDDHLDIRKWKYLSQTVSFSAGASPLLYPTSFDMRLRTRTRPPPIGCTYWPGGRVLLQWLLDETELVSSGGKILELGSGIGTAAVGLALARGQASCGQALRSPDNELTIFASDICEETLENLRLNAAACDDSPSKNGCFCDKSFVSHCSLNIVKLDAAGGANALASLPCAPADLTHVVGSDIVYHGFESLPIETTDVPGCSVGGSTDGSAIGIEHTLAALLRANPKISITLLLEDRFSGGLVAALAGAAGVEHSGTPVDRSIQAFERRCEHLGLTVSKAAVPERVKSHVSERQPLWTRLKWQLCGTWDSLTLYTIGPGRKKEEL